jgi:hypothetical protein
MDPELLKRLVYHPGKVGKEHSVTLDQAEIEQFGRVHKLSEARLCRPASIGSFEVSHSGTAVAAVAPVDSGAPVQLDSAK